MGRAASRASAAAMTVRTTADQEGTTSTAGTAHTAEWEGGRAGMAHTAAREVGSASGTGMDVLADMAAREGGRAGTSEG